MYQKLGYPSIQVGVDLTRIKGGFNALSSQQTFWDTRARGIYTQIMKDHFDQVWQTHPELKSRRIVAHTFSNNGVQTWCNVRELLEQPVGFIFDSGT